MTTSRIVFMLDNVIRALHDSSSHESTPVNRPQIQDLESIVRAMESNKDNGTALEVNGIDEDLLARLTNVAEYANFINLQNLTEVQSLLKKISALTADFFKANPGVNNQIIGKIIDGSSQIDHFITQMTIAEYNGSSRTPSKIYLG